MYIDLIIIWLQFFKLKLFKWSYHFHMKPNFFQLLDLFRCNNFSLSSLKPLKHLNYLDISQCSDVEYCTDLESEESFFKCCQQIKWFFMGRSSHHMFGSRSYGTVAELIIRDMIQNCKGLMISDFSFKSWKVFCILASS